MSDYEKEDMELAAMMGDRFIDETVPTSEVKKPAPKPEAERQPTKHRTWMDDLTACALFAGLTALIWYWEIAGLMDESVALPSMLACAVLVGTHIEKAKGKKGR